MTREWVDIILFLSAMCIIFAALSVVGDEIDHQLERREARQRNISRRIK